VRLATWCPPARSRNGGEPESSASIIPRFHESDGFDYLGCILLVKLSDAHDDDAALIKCDPLASTVGIPTAAVVKLQNDAQLKLPESRRRSPTPSKPGSSKLLEHPALGSRPRVSVR
jgi:hypothetical protein